MPVFVNTLLFACAPDASLNGQYEYGLEFSVAFAY